MDEQVKQAFENLQTANDTIESIRAELPQLAEAEKRAEAAKKVIQEWAKSENAEGAHAGYEVKLSYRETWDTKKLPGFAVAHPELNALKSETIVATIRKAK
jgi:hypothetical protein